MKNKSDFIDFYNREYKEVINKVFSKELKKYNNIRLKYILRSLYFIMLIVLLITLFFLLGDFDKSFKILPQFA